ncbi:c-type cytochrome [Neorhodopirellula pilleata]|uniref:Cytochrome c n=1 Tax=Neorhodopirellula pilleata TaxID=2714738 RepID=A0A5C6AAG5_9BACT|nr:c-type cytochrome [Neorhodopirellula pilleata]TWT96347.1 Cytochrome c [Neorhodopirellula pilleata]
MKPPIHGLLRLAIVLIATGICGSATANDETKLATALHQRVPRPDLVLAAADSGDVTDRMLAAEGIRLWHEHIPGAMGCLRRLANDASLDVVTKAIVAAGQIGTREAFLAVSGSLDREIDDAHVTAIADALDRRAFRVYWLQSDEFGLRPTISALITRRSSPHDPSSLAALEFPPPSHSVVESGRAVFQSAGCVACHRVNGYGHDAFNVPLKGIGMCHDNVTLVQHILSPSLDIHDGGRQERFVTEDGRLLVGRVTRSQANRLAVQTDATQPERIQWIDRDEIIHREHSDVSPMPTGLLDSLTPTQIADLVVYLRTDGGLVPMPSTAHDHH